MLQLFKNRIVAHTWAHARSFGPPGRDTTGSDPLMGHFPPWGFEDGSLTHLFFLRKQAASSCAPT